MNRDSSSLTQLSLNIGDAPPTKQLFCSTPSCLFVPASSMLNAYHPPARHPSPLPPLAPPTTLPPPALLDLIFATPVLQPFFTSRGRSLFGLRRRRVTASRAHSYPPSVRHDNESPSFVATPADDQSPMMSARWSFGPPGGEDRTHYTTALSGGVPGSCEAPEGEHYDASHSGSNKITVLCAKRSRQPSSCSTAAASEPIDIPHSPRDDLVLGDFTDADGGVGGSYSLSAWVPALGGETTDTRPDYIIKWESSVRRNSVENGFMRAEDENTSDDFRGSGLDDDDDDTSRHYFSVEGDIEGSAAEDKIFEIELEM